MGILTFIKQYKIPIIVMAGLLVGTAYANISVKYYNAKPQLFNMDFIAVYEEVQVNSFSLWQYVFCTRMRDFLAVIILKFTNLCRVAVNGYIACFGVVTGAMISYAVMNHGATGVLVYLSSVLPQYILYIIAYAILYSMKTQEYIRGNNHIRKCVLAVLLIVSFVLAGTYVEAYVNPAVMRWVYGRMW